MQLIFLQYPRPLGTTQWHQLPQRSRHLSWRKSLKAAHHSEVVACHMQFLACHEDLAHHVQACREVTKHGIVWGCNAFHQSTLGLQ